MHASSVYASSDSVCMISERGKIAKFLKMFQTLQNIHSSIMHHVKPSSYHLKKESCYKPKINTNAFKKNSFITRLVFRYELPL